MASLLQDKLRLGVLEHFISLSSHYSLLLNSYHMLAGRTSEVSRWNARQEACYGVHNSEPRVICVYTSVYMKQKQQVLL